MANRLSTITFDEVTMFRVDADPAAGSGTVANIGDIAFLDNSVGYGCWIKKGAGDTAWVAMVDADTLTSTVGPKLYNNTTLLDQNQYRLYTHVLTTDSNSRCTFRPTSDGTSGGTALFSAIYSVQATAVYGGSTSHDAKIAYIESIAADKKSVNIRVITGRTIPTISLGTSTLEFAGSGVTVYVTIAGAV